MNVSAFYLKVQQLDKKCLFDLSWGTGQNIGVTFAYPENLTALYQEWQRVYLRFYNTALRGRVEEIGSLTTPPVDWHAKLVQAEAQLLSEFHHWLRSAELYEIRAAIAQATNTIKTPYIDVFLSCNPLELARLPWEVWEIGIEFALDARKIRIVRTPTNRRETVTNFNRRDLRKARILAILGDDSGLDFQAEKKAIGSLTSLAEVTFVGWQPGESISELKTKIVNAISSDLGWDILFFAGHSNETNLTGGEIAIAPKVALLVSEIEQSLTIAKSRGLQVAIFNSCKGLSIANKLIDLGISQVAVMREPIHNCVAEEFFLRFLQALSQYEDVHTSLLAASKYLKLEKNLTYPSAYLIPSLFRHPEAELFRLKPLGFKQFLNSFKPSRQEAIAVSALLVISLLLPVQSFLLQRRILTQAIYRQITRQVAPATNPPPVLLVQIDEESIRKANISNPKPMDRKYLGSLVNRLKADNARVIGIDYLMDRPQPQSDRILAKSIQTAIASLSNPTWFVFAGTYNDNVWLRVLPEIASLHWSLEGEIDNYPWYMELLPHDNFQSQPWHFAGLLALTHQLQQIPNAPQPRLDSKTDLFQQISDFFNHSHKDAQTILTSKRTHLQLITVLSYQIQQTWLHPIIDFSIPPHQVYHSIPAWQLLENQAAAVNLQQQIVIIAPGGYYEAGIVKEGDDNFRDSESPLGIKYWRSQEQPANNSTVFTGGEYHAYIIHHFLTQRLVIPIPDLWVIGVAIFLGKNLYLWIHINKYKRWQLLVLPILITGIYGLLSLQVYISASAVLLPWFLPSITLWFYVLLTVLRRKIDE
ncbi:CHASE2 domain-containing protein [Nostoc sp. UHCC 0302]|uniref:CHASE2 domain-containing protein n=1 Tax=Nostoc sp. UHCC 0302 TaxID=3134896 RepID=UPI00311CA2D3